MGIFSGAEGGSSAVLFLMDLGDSWRNSREFFVQPFLIYFQKIG